MSVKLMMSTTENDAYNLHGVGNQRLKSLELLEVILGLDIVGRGDNHTGHEGTEGSDTITLTCFMLIYTRFSYMLVTNQFREPRYRYGWHQPQGRRGRWRQRILKRVSLLLHHIPILPTYRYRRGNESRYRSARHLQARLLVLCPAALQLHFIDSPRRVRTRS